MAEVDRSSNNPIVVASWILVVAIVVTIGWAAYQAYKGEFNQTQEYRPPTLGGQINLGYGFPNDVNILVVYRTTSFSAQNEIAVESRIIPNKEVLDLYWKSQPSVVYMIFPYSLKADARETDIEGEFEAGVLELKRHDSPRQYYHGTQEIIYPFEGNYGYLFIHPLEVEGSHQQGSLSSLYLNASLQERIIKETSFEIASAEATTTMRTNNIFLSLTMVFLAFAVMDQRDAIRDSILFMFRVAPRIRVFFKMIRTLIIMRLKRDPPSV